MRVTHALDAVPTALLWPMLRKTSLDVGPERPKRDWTPSKVTRLTQLDSAKRLNGCGHARESLSSSPAEIYLRRIRRYDGSFPPTLGFLPPFRPEHQPALIAAFGIPTETEPGLVEIGDVHGVHLTLLKPDGSGKPDIEKPKLFVGPSKGWPIVIAPPNDLLGLGVTEGIEDGLSVRQVTGLGVWVAGAANRLPVLAEKVPACIESVTIYGHADENGNGQRGAYGRADSLLSRGIEVFVEGLP